MKILCVKCKREFDSAPLLRVQKDSKRSDYEERNEFIATSAVCDDCMNDVANIF